MRRIKRETFYQLKIREGPHCHADHFTERFLDIAVGGRIRCSLLGTESDTRG